MRVSKCPKNGCCAMFNNVGVNPVDGLSVMRLGDITMVDGELSSMR